MASYGGTQTSYRQRMMEQRKRRQQQRQGSGQPPQIGSTYQPSGGQNTGAHLQNPNIQRIIQNQIGGAQQPNPGMAKIREPGGGGKASNGMIATGGNTDGFVRSPGPVGGQQQGGPWGGFVNMVGNQIGGSSQPYYPNNPYGDQPGQYGPPRTYPGGFDEYGNYSGNPGDLMPQNPGQGQEAAMNLKWLQSIGYFPNIGRNVATGAGGYTDPSATYNPFMPGVQGAIGNAMQPYSPSGQYTGAGMGYLDQFAGGGPPPVTGPLQLPNAPTLNQPAAPGQYSSNYQGPQFSAPTIGGPNYSAQPGMPSFDMSGIAGPGQTTIRDPNQDQFNQLGNVGNAAGLNDIARVGNNVGAAQNIGSNYQTNETFANPESVSRRGYEAGLSGAIGSQQGGLSDLTDETVKRIREDTQANLRLAGIDTKTDIGRSGIIADEGTNIYGRRFAERALPIISESNRAIQQARENNLDRSIHDRQFGTSTAAQIGSAAGSTASQFGGLAQSEAQSATQAGLEGREQDIQIRSQDIQQRAQDIQRGIELGNQMIQEFQANTQRGQAFGNLMQQADQLRQTGDIQGYNAMSDRIRAMTGASSAQASAMIDGFRAATDRGQVSQQARQQAAELGLNYDQMAMQNAQFAGTLGLSYSQLNEQAQARGADNLLQMNQQMTQVYDTMSRNNIDAYTASNQVLSQQYSNQTQRINTITSAISDFGGLNLAQDAEANQRAIQAAQIAAGLIDGSVSAQIAQNQLILKAQQGDQNSIETLYMFEVANAHQKQLQDEYGSGGVGRFVGGAVGTLAGSAFGGVGAGIGNRIGRAIGVGG